ncbi:GntR family transcriptional regulator [Acetobacterium bakii]|uniref:GntR family transcriptional regulator n=1 Tax=Acetobacterium bakii TaxID=52689 RepID=UPI000682A917|nr:GntR family transcriptional regulator [Acetobacterium bakii]
MKQQIYQVIQEDVIKKIKSNTLKPGDKLPTESEFCQIYDTSKSSVKKALNELVNKGYLYAIQRVGYYVNVSKHNKYLLSFNPTELVYMGEKRDQIRIEQLTVFNFAPPISETDPKTAKTFCLSQLIYMGNIPAALTLYKLFYRKELSSKKQAKYSDPDQLTEILEAFTRNRKLKIFGEEASSFVAENLKIPLLTPILAVEESYYDQYEKLIGKITVYYRKEYMQLSGVSNKSFLKQL